MSFWTKIKEAVAGAPMPSTERIEALRAVEPTVAFAAGQRWSYKTRERHEGSTLRVLVVDSVEDRPVVHVAIEGLQLKAPEGTVLHEVGHLPMAEEALRASVRRLLASDVEVRSLEGYEQWKEAQGGVFTLTVAETVDMLEKAMEAPGE